jgi:hypothetical protein
MVQVKARASRGTEGGHMQNTDGDAPKSSTGWRRWKNEMKDNRLGFLFIVIWMALGIPLLYFARMLR